MKKTIFLLLLIFALPDFLVSADLYDWQIILSGGKSQTNLFSSWIGYDKVSQDPISRTLVCSGQGCNQAKLMLLKMPEAILSNTNKVIQKVNNEIHSGTLNGNLTTEYNYNKKKITTQIYWTTDSCKNSNIKVKISD